MARISIAALLLALAVAAPAQGKGGGAVSAAEVCGAEACRAVAQTADMGRMAESLFSAISHGDRRIAPGVPAPHYEIRVWSAHEPGLFDTPLGEPVAIDYLPHAAAVRVRAPASKRHWARLDPAGSAVLRRSTAGLEPFAAGATTLRVPSPEEDGPATIPLAAGLAGAVLALSGWGVTRRHRRRAS